MMYEQLLKTIIDMDKKQLLEMMYDLNDSHTVVKLIEAANEYLEKEAKK